jgi:hypothetical protein
LLLEERLRIASEKEISDYQNDAANSTADGNPSSAPGTAIVFDVLAFPPALPKHSVGWRDFARLQTTDSERRGAGVSNGEYCGAQSLGEHMFADDEDPEF